MTLRRLGISVETCKTTDEAVKRFEKTRYDAIVSDMKRPEGGKAGIDLVRRLRNVPGKDQTPFLIFCGGWAAKNLIQEAQEAGATGITSSGTTLLSLLRAELA